MVNEREQSCMSEIRFSSRRCTCMHENHSPFGDIRRFEAKTGDLRESLDSMRKVFFWGGGGVR